MTKKTMLVMAFLLIGIVFKASAFEASAEASVFKAQANELRIISLTPHITELMIALGAGHQLVGVDDYAKNKQNLHRIESVGDVYALDMEKIIMLRPDIIIAWRDAHQKQIKQLQALNYTVLFSSAQKLADIIKEIKLIGVKLGQKANASKLVKTMEEKIANLKNKYKNKKKMRVFYPLWYQPLMTIGGKQIISQTLPLCGAENVFANENILTLNTNPEAVIKEKPDLVIINEPAQNSYWQKLELTTKYVDTDQLARMNHLFLEGMIKLCQGIDGAR